MSEVIKFKRRPINEWPRHVFLADFGDGDGCRPHSYIQYPDDTTPKYVRADLFDALEAENARLRDALAPMLDWATQHAAYAPEWDEDCTVRPVVRIGDLRRAMKALT